MILHDSPLFRTDVCSGGLMVQCRQVPSGLNMTAFDCLSASGTQETMSQNKKVAGVAFLFCFTADEACFPAVFLKVWNET